MSDHYSGHCRCDRRRMGSWIILFMISLALLLSSAALFIRVLMSI